MNLNRQNALPVLTVVIIVGFFGLMLVLLLSEAPRVQTTQLAFPDPTERLPTAAPTPLASPVPTLEATVEVTASADTTAEATLTVEMTETVTTAAEAADATEETPEP